MGITRKSIAVAAAVVSASVAVGQGQPNVTAHAKDGFPPGGSPAGTKCFKIDTTNVTQANPFNRICLDINQVAAAPHPMDGRVSPVSATNAVGGASEGWSASVVFEDNRWRLCIDRPTNETNNITFKICIEPVVQANGRRRTAALGGTRWRYSREAGAGGNGIGGRAPHLISAAATTPADLNGDGVVNGADLGLLLNNWSGGGLGDLNGDGIVSGADLGLLLTSWGAVEEAPCDDPICIAGLCELAPACCDADWDLACAWLASELCGCDAPADFPLEVTDQPCDGAGEGPGCFDPFVVACVCPTDPYCCLQQWDSVCALHALVECGAGGDEFAVYDIDSTDLTTGDIVTIRGVGFPDDPHDIHLSIRPWMPLPKPEDPPFMDGGVAGPFGGSRLSILAATPTSAVVRVGGVPPTLGLGMVVAALGSGSASVPPGLPSVITPLPPGVVWWSASTPVLAVSALHAVQLPVYPSTPPQCVDSHGGLVGSDLALTLGGIPDPLPMGSTIEVTADAALLGGAFQFAQQMTLQSSSAMTIQQTANALCAALNLVFFQQTGQFFPCTSQVVGPNAVQISVAPPFGDAYDPNAYNSFWVRVCEP